MIATITDTAFLKGLRILWRDELAAGAWAWMAGKCFKYLDQYGTAPGKNIQPIWESEDRIEEELLQEIGNILASLSKQFEEGTAGGFDPDFLLQEVEKHLQKEFYLTKAVDMEAAAEAGELDRCREIKEGMSRPPSMSVIDSSNPFSDEAAISKAFSSPTRSLVRMGGEVQEMVGSQIVPDSFVAFLGKEKSGKSWWMQSLVFSALKAGTNVLLYVVGDLSQPQLDMRLLIQLTGRNNKERYCQGMWSPVPDCLQNQTGECQKPERPSAGSVILKEIRPYPVLMRPKDVDSSYSPCSACGNRWVPSSWWERVDPCSPLTERDSLESCRRTLRVHQDNFRRECFSSKTQSIFSLRERTNRLYELTGWKPELVIVDYFDNLDQEPGSSKEFRHQEGSKWEAGRRWSQDEKICLVTATQAPKSTKRRRLLTDEDMSEDKRKKAHVNAFFGLNRDNHDRRMGWMRVNSLVVREDDYDMDSEVAVLQFLARGKPNLGSFRLRNGGYEDE
jgi:hypothetical protein